MNMTEATAHTAAETDRQAIIRTALDYIEGGYQGDVERMERCLHPQLAKRIVVTDPATGSNRLSEMSALDLVHYARRKAGEPAPDTQQKEVTLFDVFGNTASAKVIMNDWIDYMHLARFDGRWVIVNVLWELKPPLEETL